MEDILKKAYKDYFGITDDEDIDREPIDEGDIIQDTVVTGANEKYKKNNEKIGKGNISNGSIGSERLTSEGYIFNIHDACDEIRKLLDIFLGQQWGEFSPEQSKNLDVNSIPLPSIRYSINLREVSPQYGPKPKLMDSRQEVINGIKTGDSFDTYRHSFDCIVEFNIRDHTSRACASMADKFEEIIAMHTGLLKNKGLSEIYFLKEVPAKYSTFFTESIPTSTLYYFMRIERTYVIKHSTLKELEMKLFT